MDSKNLMKQQKADNMELAVMQSRVGDMMQEGFELEQPRIFGDREKDRAKLSVKRAEKDNDYISYALKHTEEFNLDLSKKARLESMQGRNLSNILLNNHRYKKDSEEMDRVKKTVAAVEEAIVAPITPVNAREDDGPITKRKKRAQGLEAVQIKYQDAIDACRKYLEKKTPNTDKGIERYNLVKDKMNNLLNEVNQLFFAKQMLFRGNLPMETQTAKELMVAARQYSAEQPVITEEMKNEYNKKAYGAEKDYKVREYREGDVGRDGVDPPEVTTAVNMLRLDYLPDALVNKADKKERQGMLNLLKKIRRQLESFPEDKMTCFSFVIDGTVFNLFRTENGGLTLDFSIRRGTLANRKVMEQVSFQLKLGMTAKQLAEQMGRNMIEHEEMFGEENTSEILNSMRSLGPDSTPEETDRAAGIASALLRKRLGVVNRELTHIPKKEQVELAIMLNSKNRDMTPEQIKEYIRNYEYGTDKAAKEQEKSKKEEELKQKLKDLDTTAKHEFGFEGMDQLVKERDLDEKLKELTEEENEQAEKEKDAPAKQLDMVTEEKQRVEHKEPRQRNVEVKFPEESLQAEKGYRERRVAVQKELEALMQEIEIQKKQYDELAEQEILKIWDKVDEKVGKLEKEREKIEQECDAKLKAIIDRYGEITKSKEAAKAFKEEQDRLEAERKMRLSEYEREVEAYNRRVQDQVDKQEVRFSAKERKANAARYTKEAQLRKELKDLDKNLDLMNTWKDYYTRMFLRDDDVMAGDFVVVDKKTERDKKLDAMRNRPMGFYEWQNKLEEEAKQRQSEQDEKERVREEKKRNKELLLKDYDTITRELKTLKETDISNTTDRLINGTDTLELLERRKKAEKDGSLKNKVVYGKDLEIEDENKTEARTKVDQENSRRELKRLQDQEKALAKTMEEAEKALAEAEKDPAKVTPEALEQLKVNRKKAVKDHKMAVNRVDQHVKTMGYYVETLEGIKKKREDRVEAERLEKEAKERAIAEGREWTKEEEQIRDFLAEFVCSAETWELDTETEPGARLLKLFNKNSDLIVLAISEPKKFEDLLDGFFKKLPLGIFGDEAAAGGMKKLILGYVSNMQKLAAETVKEQREGLAERDKERIIRKKQKEREIRKRKDVIPDFSPMAELEALMEGREVEEPEPEQKEEEQEEEGVFGKALGFLGGLFKSADAKAEEEKKKQEKLKKQQDKDAKKMGFTEREQKEIDEAFGDSFLDKQLRQKTDAELIAVGVKSQLAGKQKEIMEKMIKAEGDLDLYMRKTLQEMKKTVTKYLKKNMGSSGKEEKVEKVEYYRESGISKEERDKRIDKGNTQLGKMIENAMTSDQGEGQFLRNVMSNYLAESSTLDLRNMLASGIRNAKPVKLSKDPSDKEKMQSLSSYVGGVFKGAGPLMQKLLQGVPGSIIPPGLEEAFEDVKGNLAPIPKEIVEAELLAMVERSNGMISKIVINRSLGAASVGQAFLCDVYDAEGHYKSVVIKLLRPDVRNRMLREEKIMKRAARDAGEGMAKTYNGQLERYLEELDLTIEARNCELGKIYDDPDYQISAMKVNRSIAGTPNSMVVDLAPGDTVTNTLKKNRQFRDGLMNKYYVRDEKGEVVKEGDNPKLHIPAGADISDLKKDLAKQLSILQDQQKRLCRLSEKWVDEAVFGSGYYHGDLHGGNIMISENDLTVIDFGNATKLDSFQQEKVTLLLMAAAAGSGSGFMEGFEALLSEDSKKMLTKETRAELEAVFGEVMKLGEFTSAAERIGAALVRAQKMGFELPAAIYGFQQCQMRLQNTIADFNKEIGQMQKIIRQLDQVSDNTEFSIKKTYDAYKADDVIGDAMKLTLLPSEGEEVKALIRDKDSRKFVDSILGMTGINVQVVLGNDDDILENMIFFHEGAEVNIYHNIAENLLEWEEWKKIFTDHGFEPAAYQKNSYSKKDSQAYEDKKKAVGVDGMRALTQAIRAKMEVFDVNGALKELRNAQDAGKSEEELKVLEDKVLERIRNYKEALEKRRIKTLKEKYLKEFEGKDEDGDEDEELMQQLQMQKNDTRTPEQKADDKIKTVEFAFTTDGLFKEMKDKLRNPKKLAQAEEEMSQHFENKVFGEKLKNAFYAYKTAVESNDAQKEERLNDLIKAYQMPSLLSLKEGKKIKLDPVDFSKPDAFVNVMSRVLNDKWRKALKDVGKIRSFKYAWRIMGDQKGRNLGIKDVFSLIKELMSN